MVAREDGQYADIGGLSTFYIKKGSGHPLILIHGGAPGVCSLVAWRRNIDYFAEAGFTVYAFDQPGFGLTAESDDVSMEYRTRHAKDFLDAMGLDRFHMIANSQGAYIAARIALEDPRSARLVFTASGTVSPTGSAEAQAQAKRHGEGLGGYEPGLENMRTLTMKTLYNKALVDDEFVQLRYEMSVGKNYDAQVKRKSAPRPLPVTEELRNLTAPTALFWGKNDHGVALERGLLLFQMMPNAELHLFDHCGHWSQWDQTERFHSIVTGFLQ